MSIPSEYKFKEQLYQLGNLIAREADHPLHGEVIVYSLYEDQSNNLSWMDRENLYRIGLQMREITQLGIPFVAWSLMVSNNPQEPYVVTEHVEYDFQRIFDKGIKLKPKRTFQIIADILQALIHLEENGWQIEKLAPYQVHICSGSPENAKLLPFGQIGTRVSIPETITAEHTPNISDKSIRDKTNEVSACTENNEETPLIPTMTIGTEADSSEFIKEIQPTMTIEDSTSHDLIRPTVTLDEKEKGQKDIRVARLIQRNIYLLGTMAYQAINGKQYKLADINSAEFKNIPKRWRKILERVLSPQSQERYDNYETFLYAIKKCLNRTKKLTFALTPLLITILVITGLITFKKIREWRIINSPLGEAVSEFNNQAKAAINTDWPQPPFPQASQDKEREDALLSPYEKLPNTKQTQDKVLSDSNQQ